MSIQNLYPSIKPSLLLDFSNTEALDGRITFTRASEGRYYDGKTFAKAEENLLLWSQEFDNAIWVGGAITRTANATTAPDGTTTADRLAGASSVSNLKAVSNTFTGASATGEYAASIFAKADTHNIIQIAFFGGAGLAYANFDVLNGTVGNSLSCTPSIVSVGNGWYRCQLSATTLSTNTGFAIILVDSSTSARAANSTTTNGLFVWGAQLEQRSSVTAYTATTTQPITNYIPQLLTAASGVGRFDHDPVTGASNGFLVEEQRTNLVTYSEQFDNAAWGKTNSSITANTIVAPDGTLTGDKLVENTSTAWHYVAEPSVSITAQTYTFTVYAKAAERSVLQIIPNGTVFPVAYANFDLVAGTVSATGGIDSASITSVGNGWYRCIVVDTATSASNVAAAYLTLQNSPSATRAGTYTGDGYSGIYIWGAQLEAGSVATSYIPTVAAQVTRSADAAVMTGTNFSSWYNASEGTLYTDAITLAPITTAARAFASINDTTGNNRWTSAVLDSGGPVIRVLRNTNGAGLLFNPAPAGTANTTETGNKVALALKNSEVSICFNGGTAATATNTYLAPVVTQMQIGQQIGAAYLNGHLRRLAYYPRRLTNSELQALTS